MSVNETAQVRPAVVTDQRQITALINQNSYLHRHLDWRSPLDWIGTPPFFVLESRRLVSAALACQPDPPGVAWVRLFVSSPELPLEQAWETLWEAARADLLRRGRHLAAAIILTDWFSDLLANSGFTSRQSIVMLARAEEEHIHQALPQGVLLRAMMPYDLPVVAEVDAAAFDLLWQNSLPALERAYPQAVLATVAEMGGRMVGYQLSTRTPFGVHLARLAVRPEVQGKGVGRALVADLVQQSARRGLLHLTVNTQSDNATSLTLYKNTGFRETGERYPVYQVMVPDKEAS